MSSNHISKFELKLNEETEINFKLTIEGRTPEGTPSKPEFRFIVSEMKEHSLNEEIERASSACKGWLYPVFCDKETDIVSVKIMPLKETYQVGKKYHGKLEVIVGNLLMTPTEVILEFVKPLQIEASVITTSAMPSIKVKSSIVENVSTSVSNKEEDEEIEAVIGPPKTLQTPTKTVSSQNVQRPAQPKQAIKKTTGTIPTSSVKDNREKQLQEQARLKRIALLKEKINTLIAEGIISEADLDEQLNN